jgi:hypothetical protein
MNSQPRAENGLYLHFSFPKLWIYIVSIKKKHNFVSGLLQSFPFPARCAATSRMKDPHFKLASVLPLSTKTAASRLHFRFRSSPPGPPPPPFAITNLLSRISHSNAPSHLLQSLHESLKFTDPFSVPPDLFADAFQNPICYSESHSPLSFAIFNLLRTRPSLFVPFAGELVPFLACPDFSDFSAALLIGAIRVSTDCATSLIFESDLIDAIVTARDALSPRTMARLVKWAIKKCDRAMLKRSLPEVSELFHSLLNDDDPRVVALICRAMAVLHCFPSLPEPFWQSLVSFPADHSLLNLVNLAVINIGDPMVEMVVRVGVIEWLVPLLAVEDLSAASIRLLGNLAAFDRPAVAFSSPVCGGTCLRRRRR